MSRMLFVARALWVAMLLLATPLAVLAQAPLTGEYVSASGLSLSYPGDWIVQEEAGIVALSNDPTAFDSDGLPPGAVGVLILEPPTVKTLASGAAETPEDMLKSFAAELSGGELDAATLRRRRQPWATGPPRGWMLATRPTMCCWSLSISATQAPSSWPRWPCPAS